MLDDANGALQNHRILAAQSYLITANMQGKSKAVSALRDSNTPNRGRVLLASDSPAVNEDGSLKAPNKKKKKASAGAKKNNQTFSCDSIWRW